MAYLKSPTLRSSTASSPLVLALVLLMMRARGRRLRLRAAPALSSPKRPAPVELPAPDSADVPLVADAKLLVEMLVRPRSSGPAPSPARSPFLLLRTRTFELANPKGVVCLLHGLGGHTDFSDNRYTAHHLANAGYTVVAMDIEGHGESGGVPGLVPDLKAVAADVVALLERSRARYGSVPLFLFGSSMGGLSAALASLSLPERSILSGAVLVCPLIRPARQPPAAVRLFAAALTFAGGGSLALVPRAAGASSPAARAAALADGRVYTGWLRVGTGVALLRGARDLASRLDGFDVPFLLQHGADDADVALAGSAELMARSPNAASHKRLLTYAGAGHNLLHERPPVLAAVRRDYLAWLDERVAAVAAGRAASEASAQL